MIELCNVSKFYKTAHGKKYILKNVSMIIPEKVNIGILGRNGAGKSTLLKILGGIDFPSSGSITSDKSFSWPMGLSGGFQGSMTGKQNVKFVCRIYGKSDIEINKAVEFVKEFADIGDYFDIPIKNYSSGMKSRLSFGLSLAFDFNYLIIDETLSVGDSSFKNKAKIAIRKKINACNILLVSHSISVLRELCDVGIVVDNGQLKYFDNINEAIVYYDNLILIYSLGNFKKIYCDDNLIYNSLNDVALYYNVSIHSIVQAINENNGSHVFLKKIFWTDNGYRQDFQKWPKVEKNITVISGDGSIFIRPSLATKYYNNIYYNLELERIHVGQALRKNKGYSKELNLQFYYLSEYK